MFKQIKPISVLLLLSAGSTGAVYGEITREPVSSEIKQQNNRCVGVVKDAQDFVIGASVVVKGTTNGDITNADGQFSLSNVNIGSIIQISYVGYVTQEIKWTGSPLTITLK